MSITPITFLDPQPTAGDPIRTYFACSSNGKTVYAVTLTSCSCPYGVHHPDSDDFAANPCKHAKALIHLLGPIQEGDNGGN